MLPINKKGDLEARNTLRALLREIESIEPLYNILEDREALVIGAGPSIHTDFLAAIKKLEKPVLISADGATRFLLDAQVQPDVVVTDLDGITIEDIERIRRNTPIIIHAHGDNIEILKRIVPILKTKNRLIYGTTQLEPAPPVYNFGGFTDGDRAVFLAIVFGATQVFLAGMDYGDTIGRYSKPYYNSDAPITRVKKIKLYIAEKLISWLKCKEKMPIFYISNREINCEEIEPWLNKTKQ